MNVKIYEGELTLATEHQKIATAILRQAIWILENVSHAKRGDVLLRLATSALIAGGSTIPERQLGETLQLLKLHAKAHGGYPFLIDRVIAELPEDSDLHSMTSGALRARANAELLRRQLGEVEQKCLKE